MIFLNTPVSTWEQQMEEIMVNLRTWSKLLLRGSTVLIVIFSAAAIAGLLGIMPNSEKWPLPAAAVAVLLLARNVFKADLRGLANTEE